MQVTGPGHAIFALTMVALGVSRLVQSDFAAIWEPVPKSLPAAGVLAYFCALLALGTGVGLLWRRSAAFASGILLAWLLLWLVLCKGRVIWLAPAVAASWESAGETAVVVAGAWVLYARLAHGRLGFAAGEPGLRIGRVIYGLALIAFGIAHFAYIGETAALVPTWLPLPVAWVWLTGGTYIAAGVALLIGVLTRLAAALSALQIGLFTLLVWVPPLLAGSKDPGQWSEAVISWTLTAASWVVAESCSGMGWLRVRSRTA